MINFFMSSSIKCNYIDLYVLFGQSNQEGRPIDGENLPAYLSGIMNDVYIFNNNTYELLEAGVNSLGQPWGPEMEMGYRLREFYNKKIFITKYAVGGTSLGPTSGSDWLPSLNERYITALNHFNLSLNNLKTLYPNSNIRVKVIWNQGAQDMDDQSRSETYETNEAEFFNNIITDLKPVQILSARTSIKVPKNAVYRNNVRTAKLNNSNNFDLVTLIDTDNFSVDGDLIEGLHFDANGLVQLGNAYYNELIKV